MVAGIAKARVQHPVQRRHRRLRQIGAQLAPEIAEADDAVRQQGSERDLEIQEIIARDRRGRRVRQIGGIVEEDVVERDLRMMPPKAADIFLGQA
jgi:hypothetical protein